MGTLKVHVFTKSPMAPSTGPFCEDFQLGAHTATQGARRILFPRRSKCLNTSYHPKKVITIPHAYTLDTLYLGTLDPQGLKLELLQRCAPRVDECQESAAL